MRGLLVIALIASACAAAQPKAPAAPARESRLLPVMKGRYVIEREKEIVGHESFTITSSAGVWQASGEIDLRWPADGKQGYRLAIDERTKEPLGFEVWIELMGEKQSAIGVNEGGYLEVETSNILGESSTRVPYARGTMLDFSSPIFNALVLALLGDRLELERPVSVRTIVLAMPLLMPAVVLANYRYAGDEGALRKVAVGQSDASVRPTALWIRDDGLPVRVRTWPEGGGAPFEMKLEEF